MADVRAGRGGVQLNAPGSLGGQRQGHVDVAPGVGMVVHAHSIKVLVFAACDEVCQTRKRSADGDSDIYLHMKPPVYLLP
jgi:hypothetical protein